MPAAPHDYTPGIMRVSGYIVRIYTNAKTAASEGKTPFTSVVVRQKTATDQQESFFNIDVVGWNATALLLASFIPLVEAASKNNERVEFDSIGRLELFQRNDGTYQHRLVNLKVLSALPGEQSEEPTPAPVEVDEQDAINQRVNAQAEERAARQRVVELETKLAALESQAAQEAPPLPGFKKDGSFDLRTKEGKALKAEADSKLPPKKQPRLRTPRVSEKVMGKK